MGKKGSWIAAIKRAFTPNSKEKQGNEFEKRNKKEKNKGVGKVRHGESNNNSFIPLFREPSSVEKIFLDFEREQQRVSFRPSSPPTPPFVTPRNASPRTLSPRFSSSARRASPPVSPPKSTTSPRVVVNKNRPKGFRFRPEPTLRNHHALATKIQAAYRGYAARRSFRALKGLVRLQGVVRGQNVKRQTMNAMKQMQLLVRVQSQIQSRRIQMLDTQARQHGPNHKDFDPALPKWSSTQACEASNQEDWDDSLLTREEIETRLQKKAEAIIKRERAMAYAYSHQLWKASPNSGQTVMADIRAAGFPWWWNWLERQLPNSPNIINNIPPSQQPQTLNNFLLAPQTPNNNMDNNQTNLTPKSTKSTILPATATVTKPSPLLSSRNSPAAFRTPLASSRLYSRAGRRGGGKSSSSINGGDCNSPIFKDDESLTSCPPFSVPHYMAPTVSAKAKLIGITTTTATTHHHSKTRMISFPFKWNNNNNKKSNSNKDFSANNNSQRANYNLDNHNNNNNQSSSFQSLANLSVDSTLSLPAGVGRRPFNRFV